MGHKITIEIDSEKEWEAICALSSLMEKPLSEIAKGDVITMTKMTATKIKEDFALFEVTKERNPTQFKMLMEILN